MIVFTKLLDSGESLVSCIVSIQNIHSTLIWDHLQVKMEVYYLYCTTSFINVSQEALE